MRAHSSHNTHNTHSSKKAFVLSFLFIPFHSLSLLLLFLTFHLSPFTLNAQETVAPVTRWVATVDEELQQIVLSWTPSADTQAMGYHICTGTPCLDYDTVFGRSSNTFVCHDHNPLERHTYRIHVFDSLYNVSSLTPPFGNIVLTADVPQCSTDVNVSWTPYEGMPGGVATYNLWVMLEPFEEGYSVFYSTDSTGPLTYQFQIAEEITHIGLKVQALGFADTATGARLVSQSNVVMVERLTVDSASFLNINSVVYDSVNTRNLLSFDMDTSFQTDHYTLWRSVDGNPWREIAFLTPPFDSYVDSDVNPYDSLYCYRLSVTDACDMNEKYSSTQCVITPDPPAPAAAFPNVVVVDDPANGTFLPRLRGLKGNLFEMHIYNRQGILVYSTTDPDDGWTPSSATPQGAYAYVLRCRFNNNIIKTFTGTLVVIK